MKNDELLNIPAPKGHPLAAMGMLRPQGSPRPQSNDGFGRDPAPGGVYKGHQGERKERADGLMASYAAKHGVPEALDIPTGKLDTVSGCHSARKNLRRLVNKIELSLPASSNPDQDLEVLGAIGQLVAFVELQLEDHENNAAKAGGQLKPDEWRDPEGKRVKVMRGSADIREYYGTARGARFEDSIGLDEFVRGVAGMNRTSAVQAALSIGTDTSGGFTVPAVVWPEILSAMVPMSSLLSAGAGVVDLQSGGKSFTLAAVNAIPTAAWRSENGAVAESDPTFRAVSAVPRSLSFMFKISRELLADSPNLASALTIAIGQSFAKELDRAGLRGTGTAPEPRGILNTSGIQTVTNGANGTALASYANIFSAAQAIMQADAPMPTAAIMSPRSAIKLGGLIDTTNQPLQVPRMLENMRLLTTSQVPNNLTVGSSTDCSEIYVGDFTKLTFMMRERMSIQLLTERFADSGQLAFVGHVRADVLVSYPAAFAVVTGVRP